jgi:hypothetical protein
MADVPSFPPLNAIYWSLFRNPSMPFLPPPPSAHGYFYWLLGPRWSTPACSPLLSPLYWFFFKDPSLNVDDCVLSPLPPDPCAPCAILHVHCISAHACALLNPHPKWNDLSLGWMPSKRQCHTFPHQISCVHILGFPLVPCNCPTQPTLQDA